MRARVCQRVLTALQDVIEPVVWITPDTLAPIDHFHGKGLLATEKPAALLQPKASDHLLETGGGIGCAGAMDRRQVWRRGHRGGFVGYQPDISFVVTPDDLRGDLPVEGSQIALLHNTGRDYGSCSETPENRGTFVSGRALMTAENIKEWRINAMRGQAEVDFR